jgi:hypothetical protein
MLRQLCTIKLGAALPMLVVAKVHLEYTLVLIVCENINMAGAHKQVSKHDLGLQDARNK